MNAPPPDRSASRVNARLDAATEQQLEYLTQVTGQSVSHVVRESVAHYYVQVQRARAPSAFAAQAGAWRSAPAPRAVTPGKSEVLDALRTKYPQHLGAAPATPRKRTASRGRA